MASPASKSSSKNKTRKSDRSPEREAEVTQATSSAGAKRPSTLAERSLRARAVYAELRKLHPDAHCELDHVGPFQLLVATVLSAQTTDKAVNKVTPSLFAAYPDAAALSRAPQEDVAELLRKGGLGMYNMKSKNIVGLAQALVTSHGGEVPRSIDELVKLPGVGRKTANVVLGVIWGTPDGVVVDTHVLRLAQRLGLTRKKTPEDIEEALGKLFPREDWDMLSHTLIFHGRRVCGAERPSCASCGVSTSCPSAFRAEKIGRKSAGRVAPRAKSKATKPAKPAKTSKGAR